MALTIPELIAADNIADLLSDKQLEDIGRDVVENFNKDKRSREDWERRTEESMKLALQVVESKSFPWPNASNVKFPLITIAALQYHARSYPALISGTDIVKCRVLGDDPKNELAQRAARIEKHMSYQVLEEDEDWEDEMDRVLITQPIIGCAFKKTYFNPIKGHIESENILAKDLVVSYYTKSLEDAPRVSHVIYFSRNDLYERVERGTFCDLQLSTEHTPPKDKLEIARDKAQGTSAPQDDDVRPFEFIEQHCFIDLDEDGYEEPYIVVAHRDSMRVARIVARFFPTNVEYKKDRVIKITPENYFTKYPFIPSPDGGFYDLGFGVLLGPLNESINTLINQLIDAGTMSNTGGGFLARGIKIRGGSSSFAPNEWKPVESTGDDLRKGIMPLPVREPSQVLFTLLSLLINYGERIGGSVDALSGINPGQNTPAETSRNSVEQGMKIFSGIYKRTYRSLKQEFRKVFRLNQLYLKEKVKLGAMEVLPEDYNGSHKDIIPAADPNMVSDSQKMQQAAQLATIANPALGYNMREVQLRILKAWRIEDIDKVLPDPEGPNKQPPFTPPLVMLEQIKGQMAIEKEKVKAQTQLQKVQAEIQMQQIQLQSEMELNQAKIDQLQADALLKLEQGDSEQSKVMIAAIDAQIGAAKQHHEHLLKMVGLMHKINLDTKEQHDGSNLG